MFIIIPKKDVTKVTGEFVEGYALSPVELANGDYTVSEAVLSDEGYQPIWATLAKYPVRILLDSDFVGGE